MAFLMLFSASSNLPNFINANPLWRFGTGSFELISIALSKSCIASSYFFKSLFVAPLLLYPAKK
jgi:hypothetical protein